MAVYVNQPLLNIDYLHCKTPSFDTPGGGLEGGRNGLGEAITIGMTGGPIFTAAYRNCAASQPEEHEYQNWLAARLNGSSRLIDVPVKSDWMGPFPVLGGKPTPIVTGIPHSDGSLFSDGSGYSQATVFGVVAADAALNAGVLALEVYGAARRLRWSDWLSIRHSVKGWRVYRYWECSDPAPVSRTVDGAALTGSRYTLSLDRPLRQAVTAGTRVELARPRCVMKFPSGFTLPWAPEGKWLSRYSLEFTEAF